MFNSLYGKMKRLGQKYSSQG